MTRSKRLCIYILVLFIAENFIFHKTDVINFCLMYLLGRWLNKTNAVSLLKINATKAYWITTVLITITSYLVFMKFSYDRYTMNHTIIAFSYSQPLIILQAVFLFLVFSRMNFESKFINWCSVSCLSIFLIHMHPSIKELYHGYTWSLYQRPILEHFAILILFIAVVYIGSIIVDKCRITISNEFYKLIIRCYNLIPKKIVDIDFYLPQTIKRLMQNDTV